jgi:hypothetical protein
VGMLLYLPPGGRALESYDRTVTRYKGSLYYVDPLEPPPGPLKAGRGRGREHRVRRRVACIRP